MTPNKPYAGILDHLPVNGPAAILIRHAPRTDVEQGERLDAATLTDEGRHLAHSFGQALGSRLVCVNTSLYPRCFQTAQSIIDGAGGRISLTEDHMVSDPSVYVEPGREKEAEKVFYDPKRGHDYVVEQLMADKPPKGFASPRKAAQQLVDHLLVTIEQNNGVGVFITHDLVILVTVAMALGLSVPRKDWPEYLEGAVIWRDRERVQVAYRDYAGLCQFKA